MRDCERHGSELLLHRSPKDERPLVEQDVTALPIDVGEQHGLDQPVSVVEGGKLHRLVASGVYRLGGSEHPRSEHVVAYMLLQLGAAAEPEAAELLRVQVHRVRVRDESERLVFFPPPSLGGVLLEDGHSRR